MFPGIIFNKFFSLILNYISCIKTSCRNSQIENISWLMRHTVATSLSIPFPHPHASLSLLQPWPHVSFQENNFSILPKNIVFVIWRINLSSSKNICEKKRSIFTETPISILCLQNKTDKFKRPLNRRSPTSDLEFSHFSHFFQIYTKLNRSSKK
jgi:hypothetical protein